MTNETIRSRAKTIKRISLAVGLAVLIVMVLANFMPILNIKLDGVESDYKFGTAAGHNFLGWQCIYYWWGPSIYIGGVAAFTFNIWLFLGMFLPALLSIIDSVVVSKKYYKTKAVWEIISAVSYLFGAFIYSSAPFFAAKTVGNHLVSYMKMAIEEGTYNMGVWCFVIIPVLLVGTVVKAVSAIFAIKNEQEIELEAANEYAKIEPQVRALTKKKKLTFGISFGMAAIMIIGVVANSLMNYYSGAMDSVFGSGKTVTKTKSGVENLDGQSYYDFTTSNTTESKELAAQVNNEIVGEGTVLLKNEDNALPLKKNAKVTFLGVNTLHFVTGPADDPYSKEGSISLKDSFEKAGYKVNPTTIEYYDNYSKANSSYTFDELMELDVNRYPESVSKSFADYNDAAIVILRRATGEGTDPSKDMGVGENNRTKLSPSEKELNLLEYACQNFEKVIVVVMSPNTMELGFTTDGANYKDPYTKKTYDFSNIKAAFWSGGLGLTGGQTLAELMNGEINPSGRLIDTYPRDLTADPTFQNVGLYEYTNTTSLEGVGDPEQFYCPTGQAFTVEYEEGIYVGYRYYETAAYEAAAGNYAGFNYNRAVLYPFGYGLSYTNFDMSYDSEPVYDEETHEFVFNVKVTNTGKVAGKQAVQIYCNQPYTYGGVEKAQVVLAGFAKTDLIEPGSSEVVEVRIKRDYITSYDYKDAGCYVLDAGDYNFYLSDNSHSWATISKTDSSKCYTWTLGEKIEFKEDGTGEETKRDTDLVSATNLFDEEQNWKFKEYTDNKPGSGYATNFTRADFAGSFPTAPVGDDLVAGEKTIDGLRTYKPDEGDPYPVDYNVTKKPVTDKDKGIQLIDLRGLDYDDPMWQEYIEQLSLDDITISFGGGGWTEYPLDEHGIPYAYGCDSPTGLASFVLSGVDSYYPYTSETTLAATFNVDLAAKYGDSLAEEAQAQRTSTAVQSSVTYLFGGGANTHRSAFGGRNFEYYSEDSLLSGKMAAAESGAAASKGLVTLYKHCALNEQETARQGANGSGSNTTYNSWANEQAMREIYIRPWELYAKESISTVKYYEQQDDGSYELVTVERSGATAIMTSYNRIGTVWSGASEVVSGILRKECGFTGTSYTDAGGTIDGYMNTDYGLHTGSTDVCLLPNQSPDATLEKCLRDKDSNTTIYALQQAAHRRLYNLVNSNAVLGLTPGTTLSHTLAPWKIGIYAGGVVIALLEIGGAALLVKMWRKKEN